MMFLNLLVLFNLIAAAPVVQAQTIAYRVSIQPLPSALNLSATGFATIFTDVTKSIVGYAGIVTNLETNRLASICNATNGCGVHIHSGKSCNSTALQGGHYFNNATVPIDPWIDERYSSDAIGKANFQAIVQMGTIDVEGRVFIVHSENGTRIGCGPIQKVPTGQGKLLTSSTSNLTASGVSSNVVVQTIEPDVACYFGSAKNLEPNLVSFLNKNKTLMGMNCNFTNGCGVHIHSGTSCFNTTTQGGHYYDKVKYPVDPWLLTMYHATDNIGSTFYTGCAETGVPSFVDRPFVVHSNNGSRVSCGLLQADGPTGTSAPTRVPVQVPSGTKTAAPVRAPAAGTKTSAPTRAPVPSGSKTSAPTRSPTGAPVSSKATKCGLFGLRIFCPFTGCGIIGRILGFC